jgi:hypothetical protein
VAGKGFLYFFPTNEHTKQIITAAEFAAAGFAHALPEGGANCCVTTAGPDGLAGLIAVPPGGPSPRYDKSHQVWRKSPARGGKTLAYVGVAADAKPGPAELARPRMFDGNAVKLLDGNEWIIPRCHAVLDERPPTLPLQLDVGDDAETILYKPMAQYEQLSRDAFRLWMDFWKPEEKDRLTSADHIRMAVAAIQVNYRICLLEAVGLLGLWGTNELKLILRAMIDADAVDAYLEARAAEAVDPEKKVDASAT